MTLMRGHSDPSGIRAGRSRLCSVHGQPVFPEGDRNWARSGQGMS